MTCCTLLDRLHFTRQARLVGRVYILDEVVLTSVAVLIITSGQKHLYLPDIPGFPNHCEHVMSRPGYEVVNDLDILLRSF